MITDIKTEIRSALLNNAALVLLLGRDKDNSVKVYQLAAPYADDYPRITFFEVSNFDSQFADDFAMASEVTVQIDVWSKGSTSAIAGEVDKTIKELGYSRSSSADLYEDDVKVVHKAMRFRNLLLNEE
ncbi:hypothetical protein D3C73_1132050 [compost metagenome]